MVARRRLAVALLWLAVASNLFASDPIASDRKADWHTIGAGVTGVGSGGAGTTGWSVATTLSPSGGDDTSAILAALATAPRPYSVVVLNPGAWHISSTISIPSTVGLRGTLVSGAIATVVNVTNGSDGIRFSTGAGAAEEPLASNVTIGATTLTLATQPGSDVGLDTGTHITITQDNDGTMVTDGLEAAFDFALSQEVTVTGRSGATLTFSPPLFWHYETALNAKIRWLWLSNNPTNLVYNCGVENLKVQYATTNDTANNSGGSHLIDINGAHDVWVNNVETNNGAVAHIYIGNSDHVEVRHSNLHDGWCPQLGGGGGYGILIERSSQCLIEDNILNNIQAPILVDYGSSGNVLTYNYIESHCMIGTAQVEEFCTHSGFTMFNLFEGNVMTLFVFDDFHGGSRYNTLARNWIKGTQTGATAYRWVFSDYRNNQYENVVGNILGSSAFTGVGAYQSPGSDPSASAFYIYHLGYEQGAGLGSSIADSAVASTLVRKGNYNYVNTAIPAGEALGGDTVPSSYFYTSTPSWWSGGKAWPPIGPDLSPMHTAIPAEDRYNGVSPSPTPGKTGFFFSN